MTVFYQEEDSPKRCKFLASSLKSAFAKCRTFRSISTPESEEAAADFDEEEEVFVSAVISKYMESKCKRKYTFGIDSFKWALSPETGGGNREGGSGGGGSENSDDFYSTCTRLSRCSSATSFEAFHTVKSRFSRSSSLNRIDFRGFSRRSILLDFCHCEGWPFGLCRKALLLPPLPNSPSDSWSWNKSSRTIKLHA
ncbi:uncharacterized protein LOC127246379 [Andrographis paniculata]|uniref:uncharacterized protein LOC127246379 n=1 Tax=Andrographis paniculata TaxID=175694 RepID=UPI0021E777FD|nr:uncharacterized protein LOC127246379 [Andrographis paniculata]